MKNVIGLNIDDTNKILGDELKQAMIPRFKKNELLPNSEVETNVFGKIQTIHGLLMFKRASTYWVVEGLIPEVLAKELYANDGINKDVRAGGDIGCVDPCHYLIEQNGVKFVPSYHIDSQAGLLLFSLMIQNKIGQFKT